MFFGTLFYSQYDGMGFSKGFFMAVNVGYSIGWGYPVDDNPVSKFFSTCYVLIGASAVAVCVGYFAQHMIESSNNWYTTLLDEKIVEDKRVSIWKRIRNWYEIKKSAVHMILIWVLWISILVIFSCVNIKWSFIDGLYFAVASLSTGGLWAMPNDSPDWYYGVGKKRL
jgi:hypothetical protein